MTRLALLLACLLIGTDAFAAMQSKPLTWQLDDTTFAGYLVYDDAAGPKAGLLMVPNWMGVNDSAVEKARRIAARGYVVLLADVYGSTVRPKNTDEAGAAAHAAYADLPRLRARAQKALAVLREQVGTAPIDGADIGAIGFCFGGAVVLELARSGAELDAVVTFHASLDTTMPAEPGAIKPSLLVTNGYDDRYVPVDKREAFKQEMSKAGADWVFVDFADAVHCFSEFDAASPPGCVYNEKAARRAYRMMDDFFAEAFAGD